MDSAPQQEKSFDGAAESLDQAGRGIAEICLLLIRANSCKPPSTSPAPVELPRQQPRLTGRTAESRLSDEKQVLRFAQDDMSKIEFFRSSQIYTDCDQCGGRVDMLKGGVCTRCRRILCYRHLHGSYVRRLIADIRGTAVCVRCRAGGS